jgi:cell fate regulator YaaT (PSP1 superfamily)
MAKLYACRRVFGHLCFINFLYFCNEIFILIYIDMDYQLYNGQCCINSEGCCKHREKLSTYDWLCDIPEAQRETDYVEVQFKNTRKDYFVNGNGLDLVKGDLVAVESLQGHDIGTVSLTGKLVLLQMKKHHIRPEAAVRRVYRKAKPADIEKYEEAKGREHETMIRSRKIAEALRLNMKIGDVEFQGDGGKAIFYYIADERIDFRQLIKDLADAFRIRIEMKQIGARQEAGRIGGIGSCGRELCCSGWMCNFASIATSAARVQDISLNPQKMAGQCAKLKCCLNYELNAYLEAQQSLPSREVALETMDATYYHFKTDVFKGLIQYSTDKYAGYNLVTISSERAFEVMAMNKKGRKPYSLLSDKAEVGVQRNANDILGESLTRFDALEEKGELQVEEQRGRGEARNGSRTLPQVARRSKRGNVR